MTDQSLKVLSLGAGVQSTTLLLMSLEDDTLGRPDLVIFADTQWEPAAVYEHLGRLEERMAREGIPFQRVTAGDLREHALRAVRGEMNTFPGIPLRAKGALMKRQCTRLFKLRPIRRAARAEMQRRGLRRIEQWIGISLDEAQRMRDSDVKYVSNRYPLVERRMTRTMCLAWLTSRGHAIPQKSACVGCPYRTNAEWRELTPAEWADAVSFDAQIRHIPRIEGETFLHHSLKPLPMVDLSTPQEKGQMEMFAEECLGMCGS